MSPTSVDDVVGAIEKIRRNVDELRSAEHRLVQLKSMSRAERDRAAREACDGDRVGTRLAGIAPEPFRSPPAADAGGSVARVLVQTPATPRQASPMWASTISRQRE